ncbi:MAG: lysophospholipid acyltransferase family protein [Gammaproteobacteria bacterium]|nr:lysophospholipid acyltransferase family protein [Gammaproteobacteria bacterium]
MANTEVGDNFVHPRYWLSWIGIGCLFLLSRLPLPLLAGLGSTIGWLAYGLGIRRRVARRNISRCFPELSAKQHEALVRAHYRGFGQALFDAGIAWWGSPARLRRLVGVRGREHYDTALAAGRNVILLAPHFLGLELGGMRVSQERPIVTVFRHPKSRLISALMYRARQRHGAVLIEHNKPLTTLIRQVKAGKPLYYLPDQDAGRRNSVFAPFFGIPTATFAVLGRLAALADAVVIPCWTRQLPWGKGYEVVFEAPLTDFPSGDPQQDTMRMNAAVEHTVRQAPSQYFWLHKRFKTRPEGEPKFY